MSGLGDRLAEVLSPADAARGKAALSALAECGLTEHVLTGGVAVELRLGPAGRRRELNDLDLVVRNPGSLSAAFATRFLVRHHHPEAEPGRLLAQLVDEAQKLRIDLFMPRGPLTPGEQIMPAADLAALAARSLWPVTQGQAGLAKTWVDLERLVAACGLDAVQPAWTGHRPASAPDIFQVAWDQLRSAVRPECLERPVYLIDPDEICVKCAAATLSLGSPRRMMQLLGYC